VANRHKVLLIGWDAADWKVIHPLMDAGKMPHTKRLVEGGSMAQIATLHPPLSPMLWTSIATGKRPFKHGIHGFSEPTPDGRGVQPVTNLSRRTKAVWNIFNQQGLRSIVIGWWPSHPAEPINGVTVSDHFHRARGPLDKPWPLLPGTVHPPELGDTLAELRLHPAELSQQMLQYFVPKLLEIDDRKDRRIRSLMKILCECVSIHSAATWLLDNREWDFFGVYYDAIDHFCHGFMRYHPPRQEWISEADFDLYHNVVSAAYQFHDMMLGTLLAKAGKDVTVMLMSDHGFHPDHLRPRAIPQIPAGPAIEHRDFGIFVINGPGIKQDELLHGVSVLDITPTLLTLYGLPVGADMDGKVLHGAFIQPPALETIPSWDEVPGDDGGHPPHTRLDPVAAKESMEQLVALGYIDKPGEDGEAAVAKTVRELRYNLGQAYQNADRHAEAMEIFIELYASDPNEQRFAVNLFVSCQALGMLDQMRAIVDDLGGRRKQLFLQAAQRVHELRQVARQRIKERRQARKANPAPPDPAAKRKREPVLTPEEREDAAIGLNLMRFQLPLVDYLEAQVLTAERRWGEALTCLQKVSEAHMARPGLLLQTGELLARLRQWDEAERVYRKALEIDPDNPHAHVGMCRVHLLRRRNEAAAQSALDAIQRLYHYPVAHLLLGVSLARLKRYQRAAEAFRVALVLNPNYPQAHVRLAGLLRRRLKDPQAAAEHLRLFRELRRGKPAPSPTGPVASSEAADAEAPGPVRDLPPFTDEVVVVSGLPRSGTSMIMQMLDAGGVPILTDGLRQPDEDNPRGYFEFEPVKKLHEGAGWIEQAKGKAVKIVAPLLAALPAGARYRIIFIERNLDEILASQKQMLIRRREQVEDNPERHARLKAEYSRLVRAVKRLLPGRAGVELLFVGREATLRDPRATAETINRFLGGGFPVDAMAGQVKPELHRQRAPKD
jgi:predicted AlkP superfamily phosphohydrolase/phosphomutase/tetratricopeptide (TPR) repeat protein